MFNIAKTIRVIKETIISIIIKIVSIVVLKLINILNINSYILILQRDNYKDSYKDNCKDIEVLSISYSKETIRTLFKEQLLKLWPVHVGDMDRSYRNFTDCCNDLECLYDDFTLKVIKRPIK